MATVIDRLSQIIILAKSKKVTDYKKAIKLLLEFWDDDSEVALERITECSRNPDSQNSYNSYTWNEIFNIVHELFVNEIDRISKLSGNSGKLDKERVIKLIYSTTDKANFYLKTKDVVISTLQILHTENAHIYSEYYDIYLSILRKYVLQERSQRILMLPNYWQELLKVCISILQNVNPHIDYVKVLETLDLIVHFGCSLSTLLFETRKLLPVIANLVEKYESYNIKSTDMLFKFIYTVCQQIATDSRLILCKFAENLPLSMIDLKGPQEKYKLYLLLIQVHHPNGAILGDNISYVYHEHKWKAILNLLYKMILNDIKPTILSNDFVTLACEVFRQRVLSKLPDLSQSYSLNDSVYIQPKKKRRISDDQEKLINLIHVRDPERAWPIIQIAAKLYRKYPDCLKYDEYVEFMEIVINLMNQACKNFLIMESLCELATVFAQNENMYEKEDLKSNWDKVWDALLRYLSMSHNEIVKKGCTLAENLIFLKKVTNPNKLLKLYLTKSIQWSNLSLHTLKIFCENIVLPKELQDCDISTLLTNNSLKLQLLQWTLTTITKRSSVSLPIEEVSKVLIGFTLRCWYAPQDSDIQNSKPHEHYKNFNFDSFDEVESVTIQDIERCYLSIKLKTDLTTTKINKSNATIVNEKILDNPHVVEDLEFLINSLLQILQPEDVDKDLSWFIMKTALIARVISDLKSMNMIECYFNEFCLVKELKSCLISILNQLININWTKSIRTTLEISNALKVLYQTKYDIQVNDIIVNSTNLQIIKKIYGIAKIENEEFDNNSKLSQCKINAIIILASYSCINTGNSMTELQLKVVSTILKLKKYSLSSKVDVFSVLTILDIFVNMSNDLYTEDFMEYLMDFVMELFKNWQKDDKITRYLIQILPKLVEMNIVINNSDNVHNVLLICKLYHDIFAKGVFGQLTHLSLVTCLNNIVNHKIFLNTEIQVLDQNVFITFVNSPYYLVRLESLKYIYSIFSSRTIDYVWKKNYFEKLSKTAYDIFMLQRQLTNDEMQEEKLLRSVSALQILSTIICSKSIFQSSALFTLLKIVVDKDIDSNIVMNTVQIIDKMNSSNCVIKENLNYLITSWCQEKDLDEFPYRLLNCSNEIEFYERYVQIIFPVLIRENKIELARALCEKLNTPFKLVFKNCSSRIIPFLLTNKFAEILHQLQNSSGEFQDIDNFSKLITDNVQNVIVQLVKRLLDVNDFYETFNTTISLPSCDPPHYKKELIDQCFDHFIKLISGDTKQSVFYFVINRKPSTIQKILLLLTHEIYTSKICEYKAKAIHQYTYFCSKILEELKEDYCDLVSTYFIKDIGCTLLNLASDDDDFIATISCKYLNVFLKSILPKRSKEVSNILNLCVKILSPLIHNVNINSPAKDVLMLLLKEHKQNLASAIETLGTLPSFIDTEQDQSDSQILLDNINQFLKASDDMSCNIDSLLNLKRQLSFKKSQLKNLYDELESTQGFAEHCASSALHRLIYRLIRLTESKDPKIVLECAKCLGILGPADLTTMILHPQETQTRESIDKVSALTYNLCQILADLIVSSDIELRRASSDAVYVIFDSSWGACLANDKSSELWNKNFDPTFLKTLFYPFRSSQKSYSKTNVQIDAYEFEKIFNQDNTLWHEDSNGPYKVWLGNVTSAVANCLNNFYGKNLTPIFKLNVQCCEVALPRFISLIIEVNANLSSQACHCINRFFDYHFSSNDESDRSFYMVEQKKQKSSSMDSIRCMLNVVNHLRIQTNEQTNLEFNYLPIAIAAQFCSAYFSSVLYAELWCRTTLKVARYFDSIPIIDQVYEQNNVQGKLVQDILKEAYMKIGDSDSIYGCGSSHLQNRRSRIPYYTNFQKLDKVLLSHDVELSIENTSVRGMINALQDSSLHYLAKRLFNATPMEIESLEDTCYDSLWRLSDWSQITNLKTFHASKKINVFSTYHYEALKSFYENNNSSLENCLQEAYLCVIKDLSNISLESCKAAYPKLTQLQMLREIEELNTTSPDDYKSLLENWKKEEYISNNNFQYIEPILSQRTVMFKIRDPIKSNSIIKDAAINVQLRIAQLAQQQGYLNVAARSLETLLKREDLDEESENRMLYHEAQLAWLRKDEDIARFNLRMLIKKENIKPNLLARALRIYGSWIAESKSENPQAIIKKYFEKAISTYLSMPSLNEDDRNDRCKARAALAQFAHEQYVMITDYMRSPQYESLIECIDYSRNAVLKNVKVKDADVERAVKINSRQTSIDSIEIRNIERDRAMYLSIAVENYLLTLQENDNHDFLIFRLVSLWLDNMSDGEVNKVLEQYIESIPSYKFIPLVPQLAPHMSNVSDIFTKKIYQVLKRCAYEHPHHTLPVLLALKNLYNDSKYCNKKVTKQEPRVLGAHQLIQRLLSTDIRPIIQEMDRLSDALVMLAYLDLDKKKGSAAKCSISRSAPIIDIKNFEHSLVPTITIDIKKSGQYSDIVSVFKYEATYNNVGGINAPKKIICIGTDGVQRPQLVKGKDDLRQDAVMQQVFTVMNSLLRSKKEVKQRKLHVRTYKVVPLTQRAGVLEWCENTLPLSLILNGDGTSRDPGLHKKYYPNDYAPFDCRKRLQAAKAQQKYIVFLDCCKNLRPAFHHFFTENYLSPETWFERRLAYTRSVATSSIIGYILGLGDRHVSNILLDKTTAEVIHIDFGIAFEQGKVLPTPETVPFRLTRDMEAAMGVSGVEGTMRRCCEETMTVLREQREIIATLLRVLLYDPLYSWAITPAKAATYQSESSCRSSENKDSNSPVGSSETNKLAERALLRVQQKLQGIEEGVASSIAGQVERLIQQARDPTNLSRLFEGWQAYL